MYYDSYEVVKLKMRAVGKALNYELERPRTTEENIVVETFGIKFCIPMNADTYDHLIDEGIGKLTKEMFPDESFKGEK